MRGDAPGSSRSHGLFCIAVPAWLSRWATSRIIQKFRFHLIFGMCFGAIVAVILAVANRLLIGALRTSSTPSLLRTTSTSLVSFLSIIQAIPAFIGLTLSGSLVMYGALLLAQWFIVGFGISFLFRSRHWFFSSTFPFWLLFPFTFVPLILTSSGIKYLCGFGLGQPREWLYYCEDHGVTFFSITAFFEDLSVGLVGVILVWQFAKFLFGNESQTLSG